MKKGIDTNNLDTSKNPREDFYAYACGGWQKSHPIKKEFSQFGTFNILDEKARVNVRKLIETLSTHPDAAIHGTIAQKISDLYAMGMDMKRRDAEGAAPLMPVIERIEGFTRDKMAETIAWLSMGLDSPFFGYGVGPDYGDSNINILHIMEAALGLGDRDYYLEKNETNGRILNAYRKYIIKLMSLIGMSEADSERISATVLEIETEYARHKKTREQKRDPQLSYNVKNIEEIETLYPNIPWRQIFSLSGLAEVRRANITSLH